MAQAVQAAVVPVTDIRLVETPTGFNLVLDTADGNTPQIFISHYGNTWVADVTQVQLAEELGFEQINPIAGIERVTVIPLDRYSIRITVVGQGDVPVGEAVANPEHGLAFSFMTSTAASLPEQATPDAAEISQPDIPEDGTENETEDTTDGNPLEEGSDADSGDTLRIIVTAEKVEDDLQQVPISITALTEAELEDSQIRTFQEIARNTPNFYFNPVNSAGSYFSFYSIRGIGNANFINRDAVGFYVDDIPYDYGGFLDFDLTDLAQVEVLRGPQNTLYGRSSAAGVVNVTSRPPSEAFEVRAAASYGNENTRDVQLSVSDTLIPEKLGFRLSGSYTAHDGFYENTFLDESVGEESSFNGRARVVWTPSPEWDISLTASASGDDDGAPIFVPFDSSTPFTIDHDFDGFYDANSNAQALRVAYKTPQLEATSITSRRYSFQDSQLDADATSVDLFRRLATFDATVWSQELRVQSPEAEGPFNWLLGGYYESNQFDAEGTGLVFSPLAATRFGLPAAGFNRTDYQLDRETYAAFGQLKYQPVAPLTVTAGLRYEASTSRLNRQSTFEVADSLLVLPTAPPLNDNNRIDGELLPRLAVDYQISPNLLAYASVTRGYRPGGLNPTAEQTGILEYEEETAWNYELGLKTSWLDNRLTANLALFTNQVDDYQLLFRGFDAVSSEIVNADAQISGLEFELRATPLDGLDLTAGFGYVDARFDNATNPFTGQNFDGNRLPYAPNYTYNLAAQYRSPGGFFGRLEWQGYGSSFFDDANRLKQDPFGLVNAQLGYEWDKTGIYLFANNIFDSRYITASLSALGRDLASFGDPFTLGVQLRSRF
ncbi:MAG: TonB-dependent receptor [Cyanobacteria bacterium P01_D01_bin.44]